jgi:chromosome segregation ATPase
VTTATTGSSLFGATTTPSTSGSLFGTTSATTASAQQSTSNLSQAKANVLEHRPVEELLANWETRVSQQAAIFQKFAGDVVNVDKSLIQAARQIKELSDEHSTIKQKSQHIDSAIKSIWDHQEALGKLLSHIQEELNRDRSSQPNQYSSAGISGAGSGSERAASLWSQVLDIENDVNDLVRDIEAVCGNSSGDGASNGSLAGLMKLIKLHAHSIATLQQQANDTKRAFQGL